MRESMGMHQGLAYSVKLLSLQNRKYLSAAVSLNSRFVSGVAAGYGTASFNASASPPTEAVDTGARHFLHRKHVLITEQLNIFTSLS